MDNLGLGFKYASQNENYNGDKNGDVTNQEGGAQKSYTAYYPDYGFHPPFLSENTWLTPEQAAWSFCFPVIGRVRIVKDPLGLSSAVFVILYWVYNVTLLSSVILWPNYENGTLPLIVPLLYWLVAILCLTSLLRAITINPGALKVDGTPEDDWTKCVKCNQMRPPKAHHCRRCGQCVRRMDHHCPWINNCVGEDNQFLFMLLVLYAAILSSFTLILDMLVIFAVLPCVNCGEVKFFGFKSITLILISLVMAMFMSCAGFGLYCTQHFSITFDVPSMEWNRMQMVFLTTGQLPTVWPKQKKSMRMAYKYTCGSNLAFCLPLPCRRRRSFTSSYPSHYNPV